MTKNKKRLQLILMTLFFVVLPMITVSAAPNDQIPPAAIGRFSPGGMKITISSPAQTILYRLDIQYCDDTSGWFSPAPHIPLFYSGITYVSHKPMKKVEIVTTNRYLSENPNPLIITTVRRGCRPPEPLPRLYCNNVKVSPVIFRSPQEPIAFMSNRFVLRAGLKLPGVDGIIWAQSLYEGYGLPTNIQYTYRSREWTGSFPSMYIPNGEYEKVWLVVEDDFGQRVNCWIGRLSVQP
jgi:hypothetical protein